MKNSQLYVTMKLNGNKNNSGNAKLINNQPFNKENICLFNQEYDPIDAVKGSKHFYVKSPKESLTQYKWQKQMVLFTA